MLIAGAYPCRHSTTILVGARQPSLSAPDNHPCQRPTTMLVSARQPCLSAPDNHACWRPTTVRSRNPVKKICFLFTDTLLCLFIVLRQGENLPVATSPKRLSQKSF
jgi:hypothetical protein